MKYFLAAGLFVSLLFTASRAVAEDQNKMDEQFFRMMQARAEENQRAEELKNPKKPEIAKDRAVDGSRSAKIVLVEYSDFQCPYCKRGFTTVQELKEKYKGKMLFVFKHFPLQFHPQAMPAAKWFEAIAMQSPKKAYEFHDEIFKNQEAFTQQGETYMEEVAKKLKLNVDKIKKDVNSDTVKKHIDSDMDEAKKYGISGTPGFVIMGVTIKGAYPAAEFISIIEKKLGGDKKKG